MSEQLFTVTIDFTNLNYHYVVDIQVDDEDDVIYGEISDHLNPRIPATIIQVGSTNVYRYSYQQYVAAENKNEEFLNDVSNISEIVLNIQQSTEYVNTDRLIQKLQNDGVMFDVDDVYDYVIVDAVYNIDYESSTATITLYDLLNTELDMVGWMYSRDEYDQMIQEEEEPTLRFYANGEDMPFDVTIVQPGVAFHSVDEFKQLGPFTISRKMIYDDFDYKDDEGKEDTEAGCGLIDLTHNIIYPCIIDSAYVLCASDLVNVINRGDDPPLCPYTRIPIRRIIVMGEEEIAYRESVKFVFARDKYNSQKAELLRKKPDNYKVKLREINNRLREIRLRIRQRKAKKIERNKLKRYQLKF